MSLQFFEMIKDYNVKDIKADLMAGISVAAVSLPQDMAYALIAGLNPIYGLYTFIVSTFVGTFIGVSNYMVVGSTNIISLAIASSLNNLEIINTGNYLQGVFILTFLVGVIQLILGGIKLGNLVNYISQAVIVGLTMGVALIILSGQLAKFLGLSIESGDNVVTTIYKVILHLDQTDYNALMVGVASIVVIILFKKFLPQLPSYLAAVVFSIIVVLLFGLGDELKLVGSFESSIPRFHMINFDFNLITNLLSSSLSIAILGFIQVLSIVKGMEKRTRQEGQLNKEFMAQGIINIVCSFFNSFAITGSFTKSFANYEAGAKTRFSELFAGMTVLLSIILFKPVVSLIPISTLAGIVILVAYNMFDKEEILQSFQTTTFDAIVMSVTFITTILSPRLDYAIFFGVIVSFILVLKQTSDISYTHIKYDENGDHEFSSENIDDVKGDECIVINISGTLHFNTSENLKKQFNESFRESKCFVIRTRDVDSVDITSLQELDKFIDRVQENQGEVIISGVNEELYKQLRKYGIVIKIGEENVFMGKEEIFSSTKKAIGEAHNLVDKKNEGTKSQ